MPLPKISLQGLEAFERVAQTGSMQVAAKDLGVSISSVSHHVARLEEQLGVILVDRSSRPFALTREGREALYHLSSGLNHLRRATSETAIGGLLGARSLRIGLVEDFEGNVAPDLAVILAARMPRAKLTVRTVLSHEAQPLLRRGDLDAVAATEPDDLSADMRAEPLMRDPFVVVVPGDGDRDAADLLHGRADLPFLRFNRDHMIGRQIAAHLVRNRIALSERLAFDSVQSIMAVVANGGGWSIITPLGFARAQGFAARVRLHPLPLPLPRFARRISLLSRKDFDQPTARAIATLCRHCISQSVTAPLGQHVPWLAEALVTLDAQR